MKTLSITLAPAILLASAANAQTPTSEEAALRAELNDARARIERLEKRLTDLEAARAAPAPVVPQPTSVGASPQQGGLERVGESPPEFDRPPEIAILGDQGAVITRAGELTGELGIEYTRADRNRAVFRGIELLESVLVGVFDINESRQDVLTGSIGLRYGLTNRLEVGLRVPFVRRSDNSILAPIRGSVPDEGAATIDSSARGSGIGDLEASLRYQITRARAGRPFLVGNLQLVAPTGSNPFSVARDETGRALEAATGSGFWSLSPSLTAILPNDPVVLFSSLGYTRTFADDVDTVIPPVRIIYVDPGDALSASAGLGVAFNQRTSLNVGYAHTWAFGTRTRTMLLDPPADSDGVSTQRSRDLQIGRLLMGVTYRLSNRASVNWGIEVGATEDAPDIRTTIRVPITLIPAGG